MEVAVEVEVGVDVPSLEFFSVAEGSTIPIFANLSRVFSTCKIKN